MPNIQGTSLHLLAPTAMSPQQPATDNCTNKIDFNPHIPILLISLSSRRQLPAWSRQSSCKALSDVCTGEGWQMQTLTPATAPAWGTCCDLWRWWQHLRGAQGRGRGWGLIGLDTAGRRREETSRAEPRHHCLGSLVSAGSLPAFPHHAGWYLSTVLLPIPRSAPRAVRACCGNKALF